MYIEFPFGSLKYMMCKEKLAAGFLHSEKAWKNGIVFLSSATCRNRAAQVKGGKGHKLN